MRKIYLGIQAEKASHPQMGGHSGLRFFPGKLSVLEERPNHDSKMFYQDKLFKYENNRRIFSNMNKLNTQEM